EVVGTTTYANIGGQLWSIAADGTLTQITTSATGAGNFSVREIGSAGGALYFSGQDAATERQLWTLDAGGAPVLFADLNGDPDTGTWPSGFVTFNGDLYFTAQAGNA